MWQSSWSTKKQPATTQSFSQLCRDSKPRCRAVILTLQSCWRTPQRTSAVKSLSMHSPVLEKTGQPILILMCLSSICASSLKTMLSWKRFVRSTLQERWKWMKSKKSWSSASLTSLNSSRSVARRSPMRTSRSSWRSERLIRSPSDLRS